MLPTLAGESEQERELIVWERLGQWAIRQRPWNLVQLRDDRGRLFHLERGSGEAEDLREAEPEVAERLLRAYLDWRREMDQAEPREPFLDFRAGRARGPAAHNQGTKCLKPDCLQ